VSSSQKSDAEPTSEKTTSAKPIGDRYAIYILLFISLLLLIREIFAMATINDTRKANNESLWYPLSALPENFAVCLYTIKGLVPGRSALGRGAGQGGGGYA